MKSMKVVILGAGESGVGAALLAQKNDYEIFVSDFGQIGKDFKKELNANKIAFEEGKHTEEKIFDADLIIKSPGIPDKVPVIQESLKRGINIISEIEFAAKYTKAKIIAITGSNGKTTTTNLTYHLLKAAGIDVGLGGNIGFSFARLLAQRKHHAFYVLELSSFQLDNIQAFRPDIAILLNITPDHMDRYDYKLSNYIQSKFRIMMNQQAGDLFIYNISDVNINQSMSGRRIKMDTVPVRQHAFFETEKIEVEGHTFKMSKCSLKGPHNYFNATCAITAALKVGVAPKLIQKALATFQNDPHRLEVVANINGIEFINDSKATNVDAVYYALLAMVKPIVWIVGGIDKGNDYSLIQPLVKEKVKAIVCLGADNTKLFAAFQETINKIMETQNVLEAVKMSIEFAEKGDVVLLSPACSSFDLFKNYKERGDQFRETVQLLIN